MWLRWRSRKFKPVRLFKIFIVVIHVFLRFSFASLRFHRLSQRIVKKRVPVLCAELLAGKDLFDFALFIEYFDFVKHVTLQT